MKLIAKIIVFLLTYIGYIIWNLKPMSKDEVSKHWNSLECYNLNDL